MPGRRVRARSQSVCPACEKTFCDTSARRKHLVREHHCRLRPGSNIPEPLVGEDLRLALEGLRHGEGHRSRARKRAATVNVSDDSDMSDNERFVIVERTPSPLTAPMSPEPEIHSSRGRTGASPTPAEAGAPIPEPARGQMYLPVQELEQFTRRPLE